MKKVNMFFLLLLSAVFTELSAQTVYQIIPGSRENEIMISVANESKVSDAENVTVTLMGEPKGIELCNNTFMIPKIKMGKEEDAKFTFDAKRIPGTLKDTLTFYLSVKNDNPIIKKIILEYVLPDQLKLEQNYPNPFNPVTVIEFSIALKGRYTLAVFNLLGQMVETLTDEEYAPGYYRLNFDASKHASGIYIYRLAGKDVNIIRKMMFVK